MNLLHRLIRAIKRLLLTEIKLTQPKQAIEWERQCKWGVLQKVANSNPDATPGCTYDFFPRDGKPIRLRLSCYRWRDVRDAKGRRVKPDKAGIRKGLVAPGHPVPSHRVCLVSYPIDLKTSLHKVEPEILFSYPVDFVGLDAILSDRSHAPVIMFRLATEFYQAYWEEIFWELKLDEYASHYARSNHEELVRWAVMQREKAKQKPLR